LLKKCWNALCRTTKIKFCSSQEFSPKFISKNPLGVKNWPKIEIEPIYRYLKWEVLWSMMNCFFRLLDFSSCLLMLLLASRLIECSWHVLLEKKSKISDQCHLLSVEKYYNLLCSKKVLDKLAPQISPKFSLNSYSYIFWHHFPKYFKNSQKFSKISTFSKKINWKSILFGCIGRRKLSKPRDWPRRNL